MSSSSMTFTSTSQGDAQLLAANNATDLEIRQQNRAIYYKFQNKAATLLNSHLSQQQAQAWSVLLEDLINKKEFADKTQRFSHVFPLLNNLCDLYDILDENMQQQNLHPLVHHESFNVLCKALSLLPQIAAEKDFEDKILLLSKTIKAVNEFIPASSDPSKQQALFASVANIQKLDNLDSAQRFIYRNPILSALLFSVLVLASVAMVVSIFFLPPLPYIALPILFTSMATFISGGAGFGALLGFKFLDPDSSTKKCDSMANSVIGLANNANRLFANKESPQLKPQVTANDKLLTSSAMVATRS
jgi:hypothetical protein